MPKPYQVTTIQESSSVYLWLTPNGSDLDASLRLAPELALELAEDLRFAALEKLGKLEPSEYEDNYEWAEPVVS